MKKVVFDFDGVIVDTKDMVFDIFKEMQPKITRKDFLHCFDGNLNDDDKMEFNSSNNFIHIFFQKYTKKLNSNHLYDGAIKYLKKISNNAEACLITSNSERVVKDFLKKNKLDIFKEVLGYETHKLKTEKFKLLEEKYSIPTKDIIFVTDTLADVTEGEEAGCQVLAETFGYHDRDRLEKGNPKWIVDSWEEIIEIIKKQ